MVFEKRADGVAALIKRVAPFELTCEKHVLLEKYSVTPASMQLGLGGGSSLH